MPKPEELVQLVFVIRGERVMLDADLARLYGVTTGNLNKAVKRNQRRFPERLHFSTYRERNGKFDIPIWKIKRPRRATSSTIRLHRAGCRDAFQRFAQLSCSRGQ